MIRKDSFHLLSLTFRFKTLFVAGERCDVETLEWSKKVFRVPVLDHWWQTGKFCPDMYRVVAEMLKSMARIRGKPDYGQQVQTQDAGGPDFSKNKYLF